MDTQDTVRSLLADAERFFGQFRYGKGTPPSDPLIAAYDASQGQPDFVRVGELGEILYAHRDELTDDLRGLVGRIALFCHQYQAFGYATDDRGLRIKAAMDRDAGVSGARQPASQDPVPSARRAPIGPAAAEAGVEP